jgi:hypothetical protein
MTVRDPDPDTTNVATIIADMITTAAQASGVAVRRDGEQRPPC